MITIVIQSDDLMKSTEKLLYKPKPDSSIRLDDCEQLVGKKLLSPQRFLLDRQHLQDLAKILDKYFAPHL